MAVCACTAGIDMTLEALKLALEALEKNTKHLPADFDHHFEAITAIKQALAQTQEPVAWAHYDTFNNLNSLTTARFKATLATKNTGACCIALYITPPQRTWVGLTDEERIEIDHLALSRVQAVQMTEAKLKELNT
jgi:hypothetical protein